MSLEQGTYEIIRNRLSQQQSDLQNRINQLNKARKDIFGAVETQLIATERIHTENHCIARDILSLGNQCIFAYNVHFGLREQIKIEDVFAGFVFQEGSFKASDLSMLQDETFLNDFQNLYKYYRNTFFAKFAVIGNYLHMVFQISEKVNDVKTFKWLIDGERLKYIDNRSEHEYKYPSSHDFEWQIPSRDNHRYGTHPHVSILDKVFVETVGGDLTIKIEDNTDDGKGIYTEPVEYADQTLDDALFAYTDLGNLTVLKIEPYQEGPRYFVYNHKVKAVQKIDSIADAAILLPEQHGLLFPNGYYLQTGEFKVFENSLDNVVFQERIASPNGEDYLFVFYQKEKGEYQILTYNIIEQKINTPIICNGFALWQNGELSYFKAEESAAQHHVLQIWQTPFTKNVLTDNPHKDNLLFKIGNKDIVKAMAECQALIQLIQKEDSYENLYNDIFKQSNDIVDSYYWLNEDTAFQLDVPLKAINATANDAIEEYINVQNLKELASNQEAETKVAIDALLEQMKMAKFDSILVYVDFLTQIRTLRGTTLALKDVQYSNIEFIEASVAELEEKNEHLTRSCVDFLLKDKALQPYREKVDALNISIDNVKKGIEIKALEEEWSKLHQEVEMLMEIIQNLKFEDTTEAARIIENLSVIFTQLNQIKARLKQFGSKIGSAEAKAEFGAQLKLIQQATFNYLDVADSAEKCDDYLTKLSLQLEELEGKYADYDEFLEEIHQKREDIYQAFEERKNALVEAKNKRSLQLESTAKRILKSVSSKAKSLKSNEEIHSYFAADILIDKLRNTIEQLHEMQESGKAENLQTELITAKEEAIRSLKDKQDLFTENDQQIRLGKHLFSVNKQNLDLSIVYKEEDLYFHISGTEFYHKIESDELKAWQYVWEQDFPSENAKVYRSEYLAHQVFQRLSAEEKATHTEEVIKNALGEYINQHYNEGYLKGVHDADAQLILNQLIQTEGDIGLGNYSSLVRSQAQYFWFSLPDYEQTELQERIESLGEIKALFGDASDFEFLKIQIEKAYLEFVEESQLPTVDAKAVTNYLLEQFLVSKTFVVDEAVLELYEAFTKSIKSKGLKMLEARLAATDDYLFKIKLAEQWSASFLADKNAAWAQQELACLILFGAKNKEKVHHADVIELKNFKGNHNLIAEGKYQFDFYKFQEKLQAFTAKNAVDYKKFHAAKHELIEGFKQQIRLGEYEPKVLSSFVRNKLINQVYLPLIGDNLAKQLGTVGAQKRTDRMGMLLLISPPGYGKTTLMEYIAQRLGLIFMKINGPALGHEVTALDPESAPNIAAKEELKKLNLGLEMGNNVLLYVDDIQHCNPEFLQKFISLADGQRKIEGVYNNKPKTYDFRGKRFAVVMAGNPYTESGDKFQLPDMLTNRADVYNLGDIIGDSADLFELSLVENAITSNDTLRPISNREPADLYKLLNFMQQEQAEPLQLQGKHSSTEIENYKKVLEHLLSVRNVVLQVNQQYIQSAAMEDAFRVEPSFKLQGSYRDMNKMVEKLVPIMNADEVETLLLSHYENEAQTLTSAAEANLLKLKEMLDWQDEEESERWKHIKNTFLENNQNKGKEMQDILAEMRRFANALEQIGKNVGKQ